MSLGSQVGICLSSTKDFNRYMQTVISPALPILCLCLSGWALAQDQQTTKPPIGSGDATNPATMSADKPDPTGKPAVVGAAVDSNYEIGPEDVVSIWVYQQPSLINQWVVRTDGMITVPLIGEIKVGGLTTSQVEALVANKLKAGEIINEPNVTVNVSQVHSKKVYISGDGINHAGVYDLVVPTHVSELIALMGGFREWANKKKIRIIRVGPDGKPTTFKFNYVDVSHGKHLEQNILLKPGDQVYVE